MLDPDFLIKRIEKGLSFWGTHTLDDLREALGDGTVHAFMGTHGVWMAQIVEYPRKRFLSVAMLAGEMPQIMRIQTDIEKYAVEKDCDLIVAPHVRLGLKDTFIGSGWKVRGYNMSLSVRGD